MEHDYDKPADTLRDGALKATIWRNQGQDGDFYATTLAKTYENRDGKLVDGHSFTGKELLQVAELARDAYSRTNELRREQRSERDTEQDRDQGRRQQSGRGGADDEDRHESRSRDTRREAYRARRSARSEPAQERPGPQR